MSCCGSAALRHFAARGDFENVALPPVTRRSRPADLAPDATPDLLLVCDTVLGAEPDQFETVNAIAITGGRISWIGSAAFGIMRWPEAKRPNFPVGTVIVPGFIEAHAHIIAAYEFTYSTNVGLAACPTYQDVLNKIQTTIKTSHDPSGWFFFVMYDPSLLEYDQTTGFPQLGFAALDSITGSANVFVENASGHIAYGNSNAFTACKITTSTDPGDGGSYGQTDGQLNGVMYEPSSFTPFLDHVPKSNTTKLYSSMLGFLQTAQSVGVTTVHDPAIGIVSPLSSQLSLYEKLATDATAATAVVGSIVLTSLYPPGGQPAIPSGLTLPAAMGATASYNDSLTVPNVKVWADGSTQGYTAFVNAPYFTAPTPAGLPPNGSPDWTETEMETLLAAASADNWSVLVHCNGDAAVGYALDALSSAYGNPPATIDYGVNWYRNRIEHCTVTDPSQYAQMAQLGLTPTYLTNHIAIWGDTFNEYILGSPRAQQLDAAGQAVASGMIFSFHCDYATSPPNPLQYMQTAITRQTNTGTVLGPQYAVTPQQALNAVTIYPAMQLGIADTVGSIAVGKYANLTVLGGNPLTVDPTTIVDIPVLGTFLEGTWNPVST
ncbi:MAG: amidohydrolase family protein [Vulcanimicrobiaceae bacterium]